ncbi:MAG: hypothetical protein COV10_00545 [Candidatus Vogelbacteria bacterium CG10_big_fil_rev_8_21_14_0_10_51_16]|uniref:RNA polymerase sigma factor 70 region 4 type 2 domain-containing protein n=1 Tax=Candidatus Vogelbacteria bacterium CG10_big_fil_rev_8_21_14_0_10_51_16 TaxID=1975045 RepID=A0A2H0RF81_9BACT|nr:MAG: hypothetical protein COV10_00545 [Candidatus Vogelbacteria bacterium CG10_big_fil_rev_8_21_14_0_10_51_16]
MLQEEKVRKIVRLYVQEHLSMAQIAARLDISATTVQSYLIRGGIKRRTISEGVYQSYHSRFHKQAFVLKKKLTRAEFKLKVAGVMLYWGEGAKGHGSVRFANSDPDMIRLFLRFLREICGVDEKRITAIVHYYPDHNLHFLQDFWSKRTGIPLVRFYKPHMHTGRTGSYKTKSRHGTLAVNYCDKKLLGQILEWIQEYRK